MKRIFASLLAVIMLVSCFAVTSFAADGKWTATVSEAKSGEEVVITWRMETIPVGDTPTTINPVILIEYTYDAAQLEFIGMDYITPTYEPECCDGDNGIIDVQCFDLPLGVAGQPYVVECALRFKVLAAAGETITLTDSNEVGGYTTFEGDYVVVGTDVSEISFKVAEDAPIDPPAPDPVYTTPSDVGGTIRWSSNDGSKDMRLCFEVAEVEGSVITKKEFKVTIGGTTLAVPCENVFAVNGDAVQYTVCVYDIPASAFDVDVKAVLELTHEDGTVKTAELVRTINGIEAAAN